jgi:hypothetical protein
VRQHLSSGAYSQVMPWEEVPQQCVGAPLSVLYRVSTEDQQQEGTSLAAQLAELAGRGYSIDSEFTDVTSGMKTRDRSTRRCCHVCGHFEPAATVWSWPVAPGPREPPRRLPTMFEFSVKQAFGTTPLRVDVLNLNAYHRSQCIALWAACEHSSAT